jgi:hypothetical protein
MKRTKLIIKELSNYFFLRSVLNKAASESGDSSWSRYNLRKNWYGRIYTIISLREEDMGEEEVVKNWKAMERMRPINDYLQSLGLQEIIFPSIEQIPNSRSYLVVYSPIFIETTVFGIIWRLLLLSVALSTIFMISYNMLKTS